MALRLLAASLGVVLVLAFCDGTSGQERTKPAAGKSRAPTSAPKGDEAGAPKADAPAPKNEQDASKTDPAPSAKPEEPAKDKGKPEKGKIELATFGGGCFWCMEAVFEQLPGVKAVVSGYSGGGVAFPSYEQVHSGLTGHAEVIQIAFDPAVISYAKLLKVFWSAHDPTSLNRQGDDYGTQYRSVIFYHNEEQMQEAQKQYQDLTKRRVYRLPIVTQLVPFTKFFPAEPYHQDYYRVNRYSYYTQIYIMPKLKKLRPKLRSILATDKSEKGADHAK